MSNLFRPERVNMYHVEPVFHKEAILNDEVDSDIEALIADIMLRYRADRREAIRIITLKMATRQSGVDFGFIHQVKMGSQTGQDILQ